MTHGYLLGVDLGTSNTVAVLRWPDGRTRPLLFDGQPIVPSGVCLDQTGALHVARDAQRVAQLDPAWYEPNPKRRIDEPTVLLGDREAEVADLLAAILRVVAAKGVEAAGFLPARGADLPGDLGRSTVVSSGPGRPPAATLSTASATRSWSGATARPSSSTPVASSASTCRPRGRCRSRRPAC